MLGRNKIATEGRDIQETTSSPVVRRAIPRVGKYSNFLDVTRWFVRDSSMKARVAFAEGMLDGAGERKFPVGWFVGSALVRVQVREVVGHG